MMIKFKGQKGDKTVYGIGLSEGNISLLKKGKPILVNLEEMGLTSSQLYVFYGKTERDMQRELSGFIDENTKYSSTIDN